MAKQTLPVDFQDDLLNVSMGEKRRYKMINNSDGTVSLEDVTVYDRIGSNFGAGQINATNQAVNESFDKNKLIRDLDTINALTEEGYAVDALSVKQITESLGGFQFKTIDGEKQVSTDGGNTWENFSSGAELLWTNPAPKSAFPKQMISLDLSEYALVCVTIVSVYTSYDTDYRTCHLFPITDNSVTYNVIGYSKNNYRNVTVSKNGLDFGNSSSGSNPSNYAYPLQIFGFKNDLGLTSFLLPPT